MKTIMIIDNEQPFHDFYSEMLKETDYNVIGAYDCYEALSRLREERPDLIIMDDLIMMDIALDLKKTDDILYDSINRQPEDEDVPFIITSDLFVQSYKNLKEDAPKSVVPSKVFTREQFMEEIKFRIYENEELSI